jgi:hypothetical protein
MYVKGQTTILRENVAVKLPRSSHARSAHGREQIHNVLSNTAEEVGNASGRKVHVETEGGKGGVVTFVFTVLAVAAVRIFHTRLRNRRRDAA